MSAHMHPHEAPSGQSTPSSTHFSGVGAGPSTPSSHSLYTSQPTYQHTMTTNDATPTSLVGEHTNDSTPGGSPLAANHPNPTAHPVYQAMYPEPDLPIANISRIMKRSLPDNAKIAKDAKECVQDCVSELISFITSEASDRCVGEKRKTINGDDILYAMRVLGFDNYEEVLRVYLSRYRTAQEQNPRARKRPATKASAGKTSTDPNDADEDELDEEDEEETATAAAVADDDPAPVESAPTSQPPLPERDAKLTMQNLLQD